MGSGAPWNPRKIPTCFLGAQYKLGEKSGFQKGSSTFPGALSARVIGATWHSSIAKDWADESKWDGRTRYDQISRYAARAKLASWVSLDDDPERWGTTARHRLVECNPELGLWGPRTQQMLTEALLQMAQNSAQLPRL